jgi:hypothetical protein
MQNLVELVSLAYRDLSKAEKLWPFSGQLRRSRFRPVLKEIGLPSDRKGPERGLDLGSLRAGGATYLMMITEDAELVRRRGRRLAAGCQGHGSIRAGDISYYSFPVQ